METGTETRIIPHVKWQFAGHPVHLKSQKHVEYT